MGRKNGKNKKGRENKRDERGKRGHSANEVNLVVEKSSSSEISIYHLIIYEHYYRLIVLR